MAPALGQNDASNALVFGRWTTPDAVDVVTFRIPQALPVRHSGAILYHGNAVTELTGDSGSKTVFLEGVFS
jgi:hypothetical protein